MTNKELAEELHKPIIRRFEKRKVQLLFIDNICGADLADVISDLKGEEIVGTFYEKELQKTKQKEKK